MEWEKGLTTTWEPWDDWLSRDYKGYEFPLSNFGDDAAKYLLNKGGLWVNVFFSSVDRDKSIGIKMRGIEKIK
jgi:hypothetical protein